MENQHRAIAGYRELDEAEIAQMNQIKDFGSDLGTLITDLRGVEAYDQRWIAIGATHLQEGLMALTRAVARPTTF